MRITEESSSGGKKRGREPAHTGFLPLRIVNGQTDGFDLHESSIVDRVRVMNPYKSNGG